MPTDFFHAAFFDMDGVTVDTEPQWLAAETALLAEFGHTWTHEDQIHCLGGPLSRVGVYMASLVDTEHDGPWFTQTLIDRMAQSLTSAPIVLPGVLDLISNLRELEIPVALVSASPRNIMDSVISTLPENLFDFSISSNDVKNTKPDPEPYLVAAARAGVDIRKSVVFEDSKTGLTAAHAAGASVIAVPFFTTVEEHPRQLIATSLEEVNTDYLRKFFMRMQGSEL